MNLTFFVPLHEDSYPSVEQQYAASESFDSVSVLSENFLASHYLDEYLDLPSLKPFPTPSADKSPPIFTSTPNHPIEETSIPEQAVSLPQPTFLNMDRLAKCKEFNGYPQENAKRFFSEFESFATLHNLELDEKRRIAAFHLNLKGPALSWFNSLSEVARKSWETINVLFKEKYVNVNWQSATVIMESELFQNLSLSPGQTIEDYYSKVVEKGQILQKPTHELLAKFVSGLPERMAFFVRAGNPTDLSSALASAKMAEACGYRKHDDTVDAIRKKEDSNAPAEASKDDMKQEINHLKNQVTHLTKLVEKLSVNKDTPHGKSTSQSYRPPQNNEIECHRCKGKGHYQRYCNWNGSGLPSKATCQLCRQHGHFASGCRTLESQASGNYKHPGDRHNHPG